MYVQYTLEHNMKSVCVKRAEERGDAENSKTNISKS